jgi:hypothetical protein
VEILKRLREAVHRKSPISGPTSGSSPWQCSSLQGALCQAVSGPKIDYWKGTRTLFRWSGSQWRLAVSKSKVCHKGTNISRYWRHPKMGRLHWKLFHNSSSKNISNSGSIVGLSV